MTPITVCRPSVSITSPGVESSSQRWFTRSMPSDCDPNAAMCLFFHASGFASAVTICLFWLFHLPTHRCSERGAGYSIELCELKRARIDCPRCEEEQCG